MLEDGAVDLKRQLIERWAGRWPGRPFREPAWARQEPAYAECSPALIEAAVKRAGSRPSGNWFVFAAARDIRADRPSGVRVAGHELVAWRGTGGELLVGPGACPHLGAPLDQA